MKTIRSSVVAIVERRPQIHPHSPKPLVKYNLYYDNWTTAFQPDRGLAYLEEPDREDAKWLRNPN